VDLAKIELSPSGHLRRRVGAKETPTLRGLDVVGIVANTAVGMTNREPSGRVVPRRLEMRHGRRRLRRLGLSNWVSLMHYTMGRLKPAPT
jgi:hypothetical protein